MTTSATQRHPFEQLLRQLTGLMKMQHEFGVEQDADHTSTERIVWIPGELDTPDMPFSLPDCDTPYWQSADFDVSIYAGSYIQLLMVHAALAGHIDLLIGPRQGCPPSNDGTRPMRPGYKFGRSRAAPRGGTAAALGWGTVVPVTLFQPLVSRYLPPAPIQSVALVVETAESDGSAPETAVVNP